MSALADGEKSQITRKGGRIVKSRYLQYEKKDASKVRGARGWRNWERGAVRWYWRGDGRRWSAASGLNAGSARVHSCLLFGRQSASTKSFSSSTSSAPSTAKARRALAQKPETPGVASGLLNQNSFEKGDLQSTLLDGDKITRPDLDLSAINDKTLLQKSASSKASCKTDKEAHVKNQKLKNNPDAVGTELRSQELILTYLTVKRKDVAQLEQEAEENLLMLCEEKEREQEKLHELKREILLREREEKLDEELVKQMEVLSPLVPLLEQFKEQYKSFAVALDATRHKLPIKNIHIEGDMPTYLDKLQKQLTVTQDLLAEVMPDSSEESAEAFSELQGTEEVFQKLEKELQRSFAQVQNLSYEASKEVSLHNQRICEDNHGVDVVKHWYFN
ncbi:HAUS augmin-like complex subunit 8 isoform X2 [Phasianus colchicus]|uniref:HAUS augmin-like complex subunit 8 isoform X2 n=1 Tax=Phasianus colchicus TaxID=9054 RepID=UPI00129DA01E|nr:HAUS augmin-like complex subunit 8 isoform X2 [Phasianus colchicus]